MQLVNIVRQRLFQGKNSAIFLKKQLLLLLLFFEPSVVSTQFP